MSTALAMPTTWQIMTAVPTAEQIEAAQHDDALLAASGVVGWGFSHVVPEDAILYFEWQMAKYGITATPVAKPVTPTTAPVGSASAGPAEMSKRQKDLRALSATGTSIVTTRENGYSQQAMPTTWQIMTAVPTPQQIELARHYDALLAGSGIKGYGFVHYVPEDAILYFEWRMARYGISATPVEMSKLQEDLRPLSATGTRIVTAGKLANFAR